MRKSIIALGAGLTLAVAGFAATHDGVQLWENGPLWAKTNVGATSPTETGYYFWWGDTLGYKWQNSQWVASDGSVNNFSFSTANCPTHGKSLAQLQSMGVVGADGNLLPAYDAAAQQWGDDWRVPKSSELENLLALCSWNWTTNSGVVGYTIVGKGLYSGNSVFIPAMGYGDGTTTNKVDTVYLWSATADSVGTRRITVGSGNRVWRATNTTSRICGFPLRPVKSMSAAKAASAAALDTRMGTRVVKTTESIAYDVAWGGVSSGTLKVNGTAVSGLSSKGNYSWTPNMSQTNYWKLAYTAGTANYSATFKHLANYAITYADTKGAANSNPAQYNIDSSITFTPLANVTGYVFNGWNPASIPAGGFGAKTATAQWTPITYSVKFNKNGGTGTMADESFTYGTAKALTANAFTRTGYTFKGWATSSGATSAAYTNGQSVSNLTATANGTVTLFAVWQVNTYAVKFNANGGSGTTAQLACTYGQNATLTANGFTRTGHAFVGWMTSANGTTVAYTDGQSVLNLTNQMNATVNLYAKWTDKWYVDTTGDDTNQGDSASQAFKTIQHAIDKSVPGMTVIVADGTYAPINSNNKAITIQSVNGASQTIIDGGYPAATNRCVMAGGLAGKTNTVIRGFTIQNGSTLGQSGGNNGGGVAGGTLYDCVVRDNHCGGSGGGVIYSTMYDCIISGNDSLNSGGGAHNAMLMNCQLVNNTCAISGAGANGSVLINCSVISNRAEQSGGGVYGGAATNCFLQGNVALGDGGGAYNGIMQGCTVTNNIAYQHGGGIRSGTATQCTIVGNSAYQNGGGAFNSTCSNCEIIGNKATQSGGGAASGKYYNCVLADNECALSSTGYGGGAYVGELENCLIYGNRATEGAGGGVSRAVCRNCTIYGNSCGYNGGGAHAWLVDGLSVSTNFNCIVYGNTAGTTDKEVDYRMASFNCYTNDPHFMRAEAGDFRLRYNSPCINAGNNAYVTNTVDFAGNARIDNNTVDIGAYEYSASDDTNFTVQVANGTGGAIYYEGDTVTVAAEDRSPRYAFTRWTGDVSVLANANSMTNTFTMPKRNLSFTAEYDDLQSYLVIDLSGGPNAASYPVSNLTDIPSGGWTDEYKTTKLVLRRIDPGTFTMGAPTGEDGRADSDEAPHQVTLTHSYYIGVFELTQRQWELVMGDRPSAFSNTVSYATRPVENVSYNLIRGAYLGKWWPQMNAVDETSFMGKLRAKTGRLFDLPTEAQWEYACRAGTTTALNSGKNLLAASGVDANMAEVGRYYYNSGSYNNSYDYNGSTDETGTAKVGSYLPNAWGLYDMHGNVGEWCLDWFGAEVLDAMTDPAGAESGLQRSERGGNWGNYSLHCRSGHKLPYAPNQKGPSHGLRPVVNFANFSQNQVVNLQATDGTEPDGIRLTWTAVPGAEGYRVYRRYSDATDQVWINTVTTNEYMWKGAVTNVVWFWIRAVVDGKVGKLSVGDSGYRSEYQLTVVNGTGSTNCFANTTVPVVANAAPTGYTFKEWTGVAADIALVASKTSASTKFKMPGRAVTLTATYKANGYTVKFNANKGTGTMSSQGFTYDVAKSLSANAFTRTGYTYQGWATSAAGSKVYSNGQTVSNLTATANGTVNLYAVWKANGYTVNFNANGGSGTMASQGFTYDVAKSLSANAFSRTGYTYQGWATSADGDAEYANKQTVSNLTATANGTVNLYAVWTANPYMVTFDANGGTGDAMPSQGFTYGTAQNLPNGSYTRTGYTFLGWSMNPQATSATYADGASVSNLATGGTLALYAVWRPNAYTIRFLPNGAEGEMADQAATYDTAANLNANAFTKEGFGFVGWTTGGDSATISYTNRQQVLNIATNDGAVVTLSAKWTDTWYVDAANGDNANLGDSASQPFKTIQHAIDQSVAGMTIIVADGTYSPINSNNKLITIRSVNGASATIIDGGYPAATNRCVYAGGNDGQTNTVICGFTIQNGCTIELASKNGAGVAGGTLYDCVVKSNHGGGNGGGVAHSAMYDSAIFDNDTLNCGGGAYKGLLTNCQLANNSCATNGAGAYNGVLNNCTVISNRAERSGGGANGGSLYGCIVSNNTAYVNGGGINAATAIRCVISGNECAMESEGYGGGARGGELENCLIYGNRVRRGSGGGVSLAVSRNCTIYGNTCASRGGGTHAWTVNGLPGGTNFNCIVYGNTASTDANVDSRMASFNCFTNDPFFVDAESGDFRLLGVSPCIDAGDNQYVSGETDISGNARIRNGVVDIGAYEYALPPELDEVLGGDLSKFDVTAMYDGEGHTIDANALASEMEMVMTGGNAVEYSIVGTDELPALPWSADPPVATNAGEYLVWYRVQNLDYKYLVHFAKMTISKRLVTLTSGSDSKVYDGTPLTAHEVTVDGDGFVSGEGATYMYTGAQTDVGSSDNSFGYTLNANTKAGNYTITQTPGTLTVTKADAGGGADGTEEPGSGEIPAGGVSKFDVSTMYDGTGHTIDTNALAAAFGSTLTGAFAIEYATDAGTPTIDWASTPPGYTNAGEYVVWYRVTSPNYNEFMHSAKVTIMKRSVTLTSGGANKAYDGTALTNHTVTVGGDGFVAGEGASYSCIGSQVVVGSSANSFTYVLTEGTKAGNYEISVVNGTLVVTKAANGWITEPSISGWMYGQAANAPNLGAAQFGNVQVSYSATPQNAGSYTATFTVPETANYAGISKAVQFTIAKATYDMSGARWSNGAFTYDGTQKSVVVEGLPSGVSVKTYADNAKTAAGDYTATATLNYDATNFNAPSIESCSWSIARKSIAGATVTLGPALVYTGSEQEQEVTGVTVDGLAATYAVSGNRATEAGFYTLTVSGTGNFTGAATAQWRIRPDGILETVMPYDGIYDGEGHGIGVAVTKPTSGAVVKYAYAAGGPYTEDAILFTNVTEGAVAVWYTVEAESYASVTNFGTVKISPKTLTEAMVTVEDGSYTYDGTAKTPAVTVADGDPSILSEDDYDVAYTDNVGAGTDTAAVTATGKGNYTGTVTKHFSIARAEVTPPTVASKIYTGGLLKADVSSTARYSVANDGGVDVGSYPVTLTLTDAANYRWEDGDSNPLNLTFTIAKAANSWTTEPSISGWTYGQAANMPDMGAALFGNVQVSYSATPQNAGSYTATFTVPETANYAGLTKAVQFTIAKATYDMSGARWSNGAFTYDGTQKSVVVEGLPSGVSVKTYADNAKTAAGNYTATATLNYDATNFNVPAIESCSWSIARKSIAGATVTLGPALVYAGSEQEQTVASVTVDGLAATYAVSGNHATEAGSYMLTVSGTGNFTGTATRQWQIRPDAIVESVTSYDGIYDGEGHGIGVAVTKPTSGAAVKYAYAAGGPYTEDEILFTNVTEVAISVWYTVEAENYASVTNFGTVKISPKTLTEAMVTVEDVSYVYDGSAKTPAVTVADGEPSILKESDYDVVYSDNVGAGTDTAAVTATGKGNYTGTVTKRFSIGKAEVAPPTVASKTYTGGLLKADVSSTARYTVANDGGVAVGAYPVTLTLTDSANYRWEDGDSNPLNLTFTIAKAANGWTTEPSISGWTYGQAANMPDMGAALFGNVQVSYSAAPQNAGGYTATFTVPETANYAGLTKVVPFTITKATYDMSGACWDYAGAFRYDGGQKEVLVSGLPDGVTVSAYVGNTATAPGSYTAHATLAYDAVNCNAPSIADLQWSISSSEGSKLEELFDGLPVTVAPDGEGGWTVTITNDIDSADLPIEIHDNLGKVTIDLNGHDLSGADGADGDDTTPGGAGQPAIVIVPGDGEGDSTELSIVTTGGDAAVKGGDGGDGNPGGDGAPAIAVADDANDGVLVNVGEGVTARGGDGGASDSGDGGNGGAGIAGNVGTNDGTIIGGSGGSSVSGDGGNGGPGVDGNVDVNNGAISGGAGGGSESGEHGSHGEGVTGEVGTDNGVILPYALTEEMVGEIAAQPFTGEAVTPALEIYDAVHGRAMVEGVDYALSWKDNIWPGTASVTVTGIGDYIGSVTRRFAIGTPVEHTLKAGKYFKATLAELGYDVPTNGTAYSVTAYGLPAGLKLKYNAAVTKKSGKKTVVVKPAKVEWWIEGVPTASLDFFTNPPYLVITANGRTVTVALPVEVLAQDVVVLADLVLGQSVNTNGYLAGVTNGWTVTGLPTGLKYTAKLLTTVKKKGKKVISVTTNALPYSVYGKTTKAGLFTVTAKKKVGSYYETKKYRVLVKPAPVDESLFGDNLVDIESMAYDPVEWDLVNGGHVGRLALPAVSAVGGNVAKVTGLPTGLTFAAKDTYAYTNAKKKKGKYLKQKGQTIVGTPTKTGTYVVTFTKNVKSGKKTVARTAQILWVVTQNDAELSLGFNNIGGVIESGVVGLKYADMMAFAATSNATVTASGLPAGIKLANLGGGAYAFTGYTAKAGTYLVTVKATLNGKTITQRVALKVDALPAWAKGTFNGYVAGEDGATNGLATVTVSAAGKVSGKFYDRGTNWTFTAASYTAAVPEAASYSEFICSNVVAKFAYKVTEKVKGKKKTVTKYVTRSFTLAVAESGTRDACPYRGVATLEEVGGGSTVRAWQNLWGSTCKALGKTLFSSKSGKKTLAYRTFAIKSTDPAGEAMGLLPTETLSLKVTTAGAVTATMSFDTGKKSKGKAVIYKATCSTVVIPLTTPDATEFKGMAFIYFAPSTKNNFPGFVGAAPF